MDSGPIPFTSIVEYARIYEVEDEDEFRYLIREMDGEYMKRQKAKNGSTNPSKKNNSKG